MCKSKGCSDSLYALVVYFKYSFGIALPCQKKWCDKQQTVNDLVYVYFCCYIKSYTTILFYDYDTR